MKHGTKYDGVPLSRLRAAQCRNMKWLIVFVGGIMYAGFLPAQSIRSTEEAQFDSTYAAHIKMEEINGVYIPKDLDDAFSELERLSSPEDLENFRKAPEDAARSKLFFGLGKWMIVNWGFYEGSRLSDYLRKAGLQHPDDMARVILVCFQRHLNGQPLRFDEEVAYYKAFREKERLERENQKEVIDEKTHPKKE